VARFIAGFITTCLLAAACLLLALPAAAREAQPVAPDAALEARVNTLAEELRCLVCQNQSLADSHAPLAIDLKNQVREMMAAGRTDAEVVQYLVARYGDFVLYRPPLRASTVLLWLGPALLVILSLFFFVRSMRRMGREAPTVAPVDPDAARRVDALLGLAPSIDPSKDTP
jgi:cytochrome c-type biogenesis protein CcmH/NrfF